MSNHKSESSFTRGDLARETGCNIETIRHYEKAGLLPNPPRTTTGYRVYSAAHVTRLRFIMRARELGFSTVDIRGLLGLEHDAAPTCAKVKALTERHLADLRSRIADLTLIEAVLAETAERCSGIDVPDCAILDKIGSKMF